MKQSAIRRGKAGSLANLVMFGAGAAALAALLAIAIRARRRRAPIDAATRVSPAVDTWENEGGAPAPRNADRGRPASAGLGS